MVHLHVRDEKGRLTADTGLFRETVERIREKSDIIIEASTGGVSGLTIQERCAPLLLEEVECASLNVGSVNLGEAVYQNPIGEVRYCVEEILRTGKTPEVEVFEIGMIHTTLELAKEYRFIAPLLFSIVLGHYGAAPATIQALDALKSFIPDNMVWGITHAHRQENSLIEAALDRGAKTVRIGFEDSDIVDNGVQAKNNAEIAAHFASLLEKKGLEPMAPAEARKYLNIAGKGVL